MRLITDILRDIRGGRVVRQASRLLNELVLAVDETGKPGELTIVIKVKPEKGGGSAKDLTVACKLKKPLEDLPNAIFFSDTAGDLHRSDPAQAEMPFGDIDSAAAGGTH